METVSIRDPQLKSPESKDAPQALRVEPVRRHRASRWLFAAIVLALAIAAGAFFYSHHSHAPRYVTARMDRGDIDSTVTTTGNLNAVITVQVGSQVSGNIIALYADFNTKVKKGQLVAEIDPAPFKAAVDQATATLNAAKAAVVTAQATPRPVQANFASRRGQRRQPEGEPGESAKRGGTGARSRTTADRSW